MIHGLLRSLRREAGRQRKALSPVPNARLRSRGASASRRAEALPRSYAGTGIEKK